MYIHESIKANHTYIYTDCVFKCNTHACIYTHHTEPTDHAYMHT